MDDDIASFVSFNNLVTILAFVTYTFHRTVHTWNLQKYFITEEESFHTDAILQLGVNNSEIVLQR